jgi:acyl-CoA synthetase (AMP-forming)/AMP-acid ligase II
MNGGSRAIGRPIPAAGKLPRAIEFVEEFPRTPTGKVLKRELRTRYASPQPRSLRRDR